MAPAIVPPDDAFMATLPRLMELAQLPGVGIGVVQGDQLIWQHYAGVANAATKAPITVDSLFPAASMGKPVFAYAVLQLVDEGKLDLDRPLKLYLQDNTLSGSYGERVTARHVLSHSSGLPNWRDGRDQPLTLTPSFEPGTRFRYSGEGFYCLQRCVEKITGVGFEQWIQDRMMKPLGMRSSTYLWRGDGADRLVAGHKGNDPFYNRDFAM
ncbi:MAG TPA: serine hydrolase domain-containing protein [Edaphobacter sp.]